MNRKSLVKFTASTSLWLMPLAAFAQDAGAFTFGFFEGGLVEAVIYITRAILVLVGLAAVIMLIIGGIQYVVSGGNEDAVGKAKNTILYAVIGIVVVALAYAIVSFVTTYVVPSSA